MTDLSTVNEPHRVVIAGGGVAGLEALIALRALAGDRIALTLVTPDEEFARRALTVQDPFAVGGAPRRHPLAEVAEDHAARYVRDAVVSVDLDGSVARTTAGADPDGRADPRARPPARLRRRVTVRLDHAYAGLYPRSGCGSGPASPAVPCCCSPRGGAPAADCGGRRCRTPASGATRSSWASAGGSAAATVLVAEPRGGPARGRAGRPAAPCRVRQDGPRRGARTAVA